jgi:hypothetical protein
MPSLNPSRFRIPTLNLSNLRFSQWAVEKTRLIAKDLVRRDSHTMGSELMADPTGLASKGARVADTFGSIDADGKITQSGSGNPVTYKALN